MEHGRIFAPLRSADYRRLWFGQGISVIGDKIDQIALGILVYQVTGSGLQMGIMLAISMLPAALFGMVAGAYVDRWDHRRTMIAADVARAALVLSVPFAVDVGLWLVYAIALAVATVSLFFEPAKLALMPELVGSKRLMAANSLDSATVSAAELAGLAFAGGLVAALGYRAAFFIDAATYLVSAVFIASIRHRAAFRQVGVADWRHVLGEARAGLRYVTSHGVLRHLLPIYGVAAAGVAAAATVLYVLALDTFDGGASGLAGLDAAITVGLLVGSLAVGRTRPTGASRTMLLGLFSFAALFSLSAIAPSILWLVPIFFATGIANMFFYVPAAVIVQTEATPDMRGRALAAKQVLTRSLSVIGFVGAGALAEHVSVTVTIVVISATVGAAALVGWSRPGLRNA
jgi:MFS family permease